MTSDLELKLVNKHPEILSRYRGDVEKTCFAFGFDHGNGWFYIVQEMLDKIQNIVNETGIELKVEQIKEKWNSLRCYVDFEPEQRGAKIQQGIYQINEIISNAEKASCLICPRTGETKRTSIQ
jgi:virulence-associated protein VapD